MYVCMCVCVCMYVCVCVFMFVNVSSCLEYCTSIYMYIHIHVYENNLAAPLERENISGVHFLISCSMCLFVCKRE